MAHTPGPWILDSDVKTAVLSGAKHVAMVNYYNVPSDAVRVSGDEHEANARLIAAAPELLQALAALHHAVCGETGFAQAVRHHSGHAYPWPALDEAEALCEAAFLKAVQS